MKLELYQSKRVYHLGGNVFESMNYFKPTRLPSNNLKVKKAKDFMVQIGK